MSGYGQFCPVAKSMEILDERWTMLVSRETDGNRVRYELTPGGGELAPVVMALGDWGTRWLTMLGDEDLDPHLLMWDIHRNINLGGMPAGRTVMAFSFPDVDPPARHWWLIAPGDTGGVVDVCDADPGFEVAVHVTSSLRTMVRIWRGELAWRAVLDSGDLEVAGSRRVRAALPAWLRLSPFARPSSRAEPATA